MGINEEIDKDIFNLVGVSHNGVVIGQCLDSAVDSLMGVDLGEANGIVKQIQDINGCSVFQVWFAEIEKRDSCSATC